MFWATRSARPGDGSTAVTRAPRLDAQGGQQRGLAARPGAQVQPASGVAVDRRQRQRAGHQLAALVLHQGRAVAHRRQLSGVAAGQVHRVRRIAADGAADRLGQLLRGQHTRASGQMHLRPFVVAGQRRVEFAGIRAQRVGEGLGDPARVGVHESGMPDRILRRVGSQLVHPGFLVPPGDGAQHAIDETGSRRIEFDPGLVDGGRHRGVCVDAGAQQLIGAQPQQIEQHRVDRVRRAPGGGADDRVEQARGCGRCRRSARWRTRRRGR